MRIEPARENVARSSAERPAVKPVEAVSEVPVVPAQTDRKELNNVVTKMNSAAQLFNQRLQFKVMEGNRIIVKVIDSTSGEVLREIPPEKLVEAFQSMEEHLGLLFDRKV